MSDGGWVDHRPPIYDQGFYHMEDHRERSGRFAVHCETNPVYHIAEIFLEAAVGGSTPYSRIVAFFTIKAKSSRLASLSQRNDLRETGPGFD